MESITRKREVAVAVAMAIVTTVAVVVAKGVGTDIAAAFKAGAGTSATVGYVTITNLMIKQAGRG